MLRSPDPAFEWRPYLTILVEVFAQFGLKLDAQPKDRMDKAVREAVLKDDSIASQLDLSFAGTQVSRSVDAVADASARDVGRVTGSIAGNVALAVAPGAALNKVSALRRLRGAMPGPTHDLPQLGWVKENLGPDKAWKRYNDAAPGARPGQAPTLMRTMPDGSKRPVKFDGMLGDYPIDRKWKVVTAPRARAQLLRQSEALAQNGMIGTWEVTTVAQKVKAIKLLKEMNVNNIKVRVVEP